MTASEPTASTQAVEILPPTEQKSGRGRVSRVLSLAIAPVAAAFLVLLVAIPYAGNLSTSPFDEQTHFDYVVKIAQDFDLPPKSDLLGQTTMKEFCGTGGERGENFPWSDYWKAKVPCSDGYIDPKLGPFEGFSAALTYAPPSYIVTGALTRVIHSLPGERTWLQAARYASTFWLGLLAVILVLVGRRLGANAVGSVGISVILCLMPLVLLQGTTVNNDIPAAVAGIFAIYVWLAFAKNRPYSARNSKENSF